MYQTLCQAPEIQSRALRGKGDKEEGWGGVEEGDGGVGGGGGVKGEEGEEEEGEEEEEESMLTIYTESRRMALTSLFAGRQWRRRHRGQTYGPRLGRRGRGGMKG